MSARGASWKPESGMSSIRRRHRRFLCSGFLARCLLGGASIAWLSGCDLAPLPLPHDRASEAMTQQGARLMGQYQCGSCHAIPGVEASRGQSGPSLEGFGRRSYIAGHVPNGAEALAQWIVAPSDLVPGTAMPAMGVAPEDARAMAAYLLALR